MFTDMEQWNEIRRRVLVEGVQQSFGHDGNLLLSALLDVGLFDRDRLAGDIAHVEGVAAFARDEAFDVLALFLSRTTATRSRAECPTAASRSCGRARAGR